MQALVGKYLVGVVATGKSDGSRTRWSGGWAMHESPSGNGRDWKQIDQGEIPGPFETRDKALKAAYVVAVDYARVRQKNMDLADLDWREPFPTIPK